MKTLATVASALAVSGMLAGSPAHAEPNKEQYDLQERCGKRAEQLFKEDSERSAGGEILNYQSHYHATLNKCFYLMTDTWSDGKNGMLYTNIFLVDANENKTYGTFSKGTDSGPGSSPPSSYVTECKVQGKSCLESCLAENVTCLGLKTTPGESEAVWEELL